MSGRIRVGNGIDVHPFTDDRGRPLRLAGVEISGAPGLVGHSDGDVAAHAVADALLGALAAGDLGERFGVDEPSTHGADSMALLAAVVADVADAGLHIGNVDLTIVAQTPRLAASRSLMRDRLAETLGVEPCDVSVKFTTTDRLGAIGRAEGIAAWATCVLIDESR